MDSLNDDSEALLQDALDTLNEDESDDLDPLDLHFDDASDASPVILLDDAPATPELDPLSLVDDVDVHDGTFLPPTDLLEERVTSVRNGGNPLMTSVSDFTSILSRTGIHGPRHLQTYNLKRRAVKVGSGAQFTVYKEIADRFFGNEGLVIKRVNVPLSREGSASFASGSDYRVQLRSLELEVLALCNPMLRDHRNIAKLVAWGYDYPFPDTPVPALFMEAALMTLTEFLKAENEELLGPHPIDVKHVVALDVTSGLEALHRLHIVHGDVKPDNVLIFRETMGGDRVPVCAKISDFGVCIDMESQEDKLMIDDYRGTGTWLAPEVRDLSRWGDGAFKPEIMFRFDAYSLGLVILSIFITRGEPVDLNMPGEEPIDVALYLLREDPAIPSPLRTQLGKALRQLLAEDPWKRSLPSPDLLKLDGPAFASWLAVSQDTRRATPHVGTIDPAHNQGPRFWYRLDQSVLQALEQQFAASKNDPSLQHAGDVLLGMAQCITGAKPSYLDRLISYVTESAQSGYSPARAMYAQIIHAHGQLSEFPDDILDKWLLQAVAEGYLFAQPSSRVTDRQLEAARERFRQAGGFCVDSFTRKPSIIAIARDRQRAGEWQMSNKVVDINGNKLLHAAAALGALDVVQLLVEDYKVPLDVSNDNGETPLYKACQAGQAKVIEYLLDEGATASMTTHRDKLSPLHWLFMIPDASIRHIANRLVREGGASVNAVVVPEVGENCAHAARRVMMAHFPFELPMGTPFHWATFAHSTLAMEILLELGADINAIYHNSDDATTPLGLACWYGDAGIVQYLLSNGANGKAKDSRGRNMLHLMSFHQPEHHGHLRQAWHHWIRHGTWDEHLQQMTQLVTSLVKEGADIEDRDDVYPRTTPIVRASEGGVWSGGAICALLAAAADADAPRGASKDTVLHQWAGITGPRLAYTDSYLYVMERIVSAMTDVDIRNEYVEETPLHVLVTIYHSEEEFEAACDILFAHHTLPDINLGDRQGLTPLHIAVDTNQVEQDPERRAFYMIAKGADLTSRTRAEKDVLCLVANNKTLSDQKSHDLILRLLSHLAQLEDSSIGQVYQKYYRPHASAILALNNAAMTGRPKTTALLLEVGLDEAINRSVSPDKLVTVLDNTLASAEQARHMHIDLLAAYRPGASRARALAAQTVYDPRQGEPARAAESYEGLPEVLSLLRARGAKLACELEPASHRSSLEITLEHPDVWDITQIYWMGFTPATQPNRDRWATLYQLSRISSTDWRAPVIDWLRDMYENETWRPDLGLLEASVQLLARRGKISSSGPSQRGPGGVTTEVADGELIHQMLSMLFAVGRDDDDQTTRAGAEGAATPKARWITVREEQKYGRSRASSEDQAISEVELVRRDDGAGIRLGRKQVRSVT
ncbi:hypothetical protein BO78DRAFT_399965 [Aspergillus sclerotiicarbonarius CBS 121057]|uniref:Protein kinase domain-containing protein n=1 Tax=Aspergillus sclerotiicarbonarius (strain CBS 121057 / IBT 28362) TaxID=1448318 RepID=A0A319E4R3_ASPSB|nr:hypothetical protein BO78DRAFT_399965 [Aspergillus sclerotiicarbonarius CBS 121057]